MVKKTPEIIETLLPGRPVVGSIGFTRIDSHQAAGPRYPDVRLQLNCRKNGKSCSTRLSFLYFCPKHQRNNGTKGFFLSCYKEYMNVIDVFCFGDENSMVKSTEKEFFLV